MQQYYLTGILFITISFASQAQSLSSSLKDDMKKELLKQIKPTLSNPNMQQYKVNNGAVREDDLSKYVQKLKSGGAEFDDRYKINPHAISYTSDMPINKLPDGYVVPIYTGGHFIFANPNMNVNGLVTPSGIDLSGAKRKKMSAKAKNLLDHVLVNDLEK